MFINYLIVFLISMIPLIELRGSIIVGLLDGASRSALFFNLIPSAELDPIWVFIISIIGNMIPVPIIYLFARKVLVWGKDKKFIGKFFTFCLEKGEKGGKKIESKAGKGGTFVALMLFVGIPLPGTGAWTGTLAASMLNFGFKRSVIAALLGVLIAGVIVSLAFSGLLGVVGTWITG